MYILYMVFNDWIVIFFLLTYKHKYCWSTVIKYKNIKKLTTLETFVFHEMNTVGSNIMKQTLMFCEMNIVD